MARFWFGRSVRLRRQLAVVGGATILMATVVTMTPTQGDAAVTSPAPAPIALPPNSTDHGDQASTLHGTLWRVVRIEAAGRLLAVPDGAAIGFDSGPDSAMSSLMAFDGCRPWLRPYSLSDGRLSLGELRTTSKPCTAAAGALAFDGVLAGEITLTPAAVTPATTTIRIAGPAGAIDLARATSPLTGTGWRLVGTGPAAQLPFTAFTATRAVNFDGCNTQDTRLLAVAGNLVVANVVSSLAACPALAKLPQRAWSPITAAVGRYTIRKDLLTIRAGGHFFVYRKAAVAVPTPPPLDTAVAAG